MSRKGQGEGIAVGTFVILIAIFIILYVLLLPQAEREDLLKISNKTSGSARINLSEEGKVLLTEFPGKVIAHDRLTSTKRINPIRLYTRFDDKLTTLANTLSISNSYFSDSPEMLEFNIGDTANLENVLLFIFVREGEGILSIKLNSQTVFEAETGSKQEIIELPINLIRKNNMLQFSVKDSSLFGNKYILSDIQIRERKLIENTNARRSFVLSSSELANLKEAALNYFISCIRDDDGQININLNDNELFRDFIVCDAGQSSLDINTEDFFSGTNIISFEIDRGEYSIEGIELGMEFAEGRFPSYDFELSDDEYDEVISKDKRLIIALKFPDRTERHEGVATINSGRISFNTLDDNYSRDISRLIRRGSNAIKIIPQRDFEISELVVSLNDT
jgi:hypothetical protein